MLVDAATALVEKRLPPLSEAQLKRGLSSALNELAALGLTGVHDAGIDVKQDRYDARAEIPLSDM